MWLFVLGIQYWHSDTEIYDTQELKIVLSKIYKQKGEAVGKLWNDIEPHNNDRKIPELCMSAKCSDNAQTWKLKIMIRMDWICLVQYCK